MEAPLVRGFSGHFSIGSVRQRKSSTRTNRVPRKDRVSSRRGKSRSADEGGGRTDYEKACTGRDLQRAVAVELFQAPRKTPVLRVVRHECLGACFQQQAAHLHESATIVRRTIHANEQRTFLSKFQKNISHRRARRGLLDHGPERAPIS